MRLLSLGLFLLASCVAEHADSPDVSEIAEKQVSTETLLAKCDPYEIYGSSDNTFPAFVIRAPNDVKIPEASPEQENDPRWHRATWYAHFRQEYRDGAVFHEITALQTQFKYPKLEVKRFLGSISTEGKTTLWFGPRQNESCRLVWESFQSFFTDSSIHEKLWSPPRD